MNFRNGDLIYWSSNLMGDYFAQFTNIIEPGHVNCILKGKEFEQLSVCGPSPTDTYIWIDIRIIMPFEECINYFWNSKYVCNMVIIKRINGPEINSSVYFKKYIQEISLWKRINHVLPTLVAAYFKLNKHGQYPRTTGVCSEFVFRQLQGVDLVYSNNSAVPQNILPKDFLSLEFHQKYTYVKEIIFDKATHSKDWFVSVPFICLRNIGFPIEISKWKSNRVSYLLSGYKSQKPKNASRREYDILAKQKWRIFLAKHPYLNIKL